MPGLLPQFPVSVLGRSATRKPVAWNTELLSTGATPREATGGFVVRGELLQTLSPVWRAANASVSPDSSAVRLTARAPCPTWASARSSTGRSGPEEVACCSAAHILYACTGSTRVSLVNTVNSTAGYAVPEIT